MAGFDLPGPTCAARGDMIDAGTLWRGLTPPPRLLEPKGLAYILCESFDAPAPQPPAAPASPAPPRAPSTGASTQPTVAQQVAQILEEHHFDLPLIMDDKHAFYDYQRCTLDEVVQRVQALLPQVNRMEIQVAVNLAYAAKKDEAEAKKWQVLIQILYTPQLTLWSSQPASRLQQNLQFSLGLNKQNHRYGRRGWEETVQLSGTFFNLGGEGLDWFQNALLSYQLSYVAPLGHDLRLSGHHQLWANLQGSVFAQVAAGLGSNWDQGSQGERRLNLGFLLQPSLGGQLTLNVSKLTLSTVAVQIIIQGALVYSALSPTAPGSGWTHSIGFQGGTGLGLQF